MENPVVVLKKPYLTKIFDFPYLFSNPLKTRQFWLFAVSVTLLLILSARHQISKIGESTTRVCDAFTRCKNFKFIG